MPGRDGTGPGGFGPGTGWSEDYCRKNFIEGYANITPKHRNWLGLGNTKSWHNKRAVLNKKRILDKRQSF